jgi:hypothetical protein
LAPASRWEDAAVVTAVVSDLHLGARMSLLGVAAPRRLLLAELERVDQVVLLGDVLALRAGPVDQVLASARPFFEELGEVLSGRRVVIVPGNHDHQLVAPLLERRRLRRGARALGLEWLTGPGSAGPIGSIARRMGGAEVVVAYPGLWLRPDVYATHGHYLDYHLTVPRLECLLAAVMKALNGRLPERGVRPDDYESTLAPIYAFAYSQAQTFDLARGRGTRSADIRRRLMGHGWERLTGGRRGRLRNRLLTGAVAYATLTAVNRAGLGPFKLDLSAGELGRAGVRAMAEVVTRLEVEAEHVIFGHTHRAGPLDGEPGWRLPSGTRLLNTGSWVYSPGLVGGAGHDSPYWPGACAFVGDTGPPRLRGLLDGLRPPLPAA